MGEGRGSRRGRRLVLLVAVACTTGAVQARMDTGVAAQASTLRVPEPKLTRFLAQGFAPVVADWYWVQVLQVVGAATREVGAHADEIADAVELVTDLDPWVDHPYRFAAVWLVANEAQVRRANQLLSKSLSYHPRDWRNRFYLGYNEFFYLQENAQAARTLEPALRMPGAPDYLGALVTRLRAEGGDLATAQLFLQELIRTALDEIETERRARILDEARARFAERNGRDIREPAELWQGPQRVMREMPPAHPHFPGFTWAIDAQSDEIVSTFYKTRYRIHVHELDLQQRARWRKEKEGAARQETAS